MMYVALFPPRMRRQLQIPAALGCLVAAFVMMVGELLLLTDMSPRSACYVGVHVFVLLKVENYCPMKPEFRDGFPATTKRDPTNHGFGLKRIRYTAQKYGGSMTTAVEDD